MQCLIEVVLKRDGLIAVLLPRRSVLAKTAFVIADATPCT